MKKLLFAILLVCALNFNAFGIIKLNGFDLEDGKKYKVNFLGINDDSGIGYFYFKVIRQKDTDGVERTFIYTHNEQNKTLYMWFFDQSLKEQGCYVHFYTSRDCDYYVIYQVWFGKGYNLASFLAAKPEKMEVEQI